MAGRRSTFLTVPSDKAAYRVLLLTLRLEREAGNTKEEEVLLDFVTVTVLAARVTPVTETGIALLT
jgi:hypothetical protein